MENIYEQNGYDNRKHYIKCQADDLGVDHDTAFMIASMLGPNEDFDGFITSLEDYAAGHGF